ncbi:MULTISPECIES: RNA polymerase sigma factor [Olivibacter]|jgi:DNA-directed RNA polymerase specialized sigma24 family protein|uniref:RNA polymerase sigma factor, sigma-70 family n=3 Tax=Sphingobacteriaceae TaxID=84566 RepID=F4C3H1_SPHS2|nr:MULTISPECIES: sigma-70 family RNA polymerase sigma factor [Olivibacter]MCL4640281.1 sigma-70 family RNA polymerase sigma factor [Olivibacter sp. UJ_SKK_5.1]MDM8174602.1 sigma-70 family RNA polymerase sigma factor [Olivibacter sp. 47]MDX3913641.1 sigma-70 family RNA polymerase sigma factor [Pseudosphingobacterium sp.]QEL01407.1 sigma-70 family RNA polymerase sigma factor [Olivibacter sp. LS-1]
MEISEACEEHVIFSKDLFTTFYRETFPSVAKYISKKGGTLEQAKDIFQDALVIYYEQIVCNRHLIKTTAPAYIFGVVKHLWNHQYKLGLNHEPLSADVEMMDEDTNRQMSDERLLALLTKVGNRCLNLLKTFYYDKISMGKLAKQFGFSSERSATVQKFKCLEKVRAFIKEKSLHYEDFLE